MTRLSLNIDQVHGFVSADEIYGSQDLMARSVEQLMQRTGKGSDFLGWIDLPVNTPEQLLLDIEADAAKIREMADVLVVIGIGGSYLGTKAVTEALKHPFDVHLGQFFGPSIVYAGHQMSEEYMVQLLDVLNENDYAVVVVSKSGTTTEPAIAFRIIRNHLEIKYGKEAARERIFAVTDRARGALKTMADGEGYKSYVIPDDVGGRFSVLTPVGLLPVAAAGFNIRSLMEGAAAMRELVISERRLADNPAALYAATRYALYNKGKIIEVLANYDPSLQYFSEWWKQLYGESEGKEGKGIFPAAVGFTTDLHSMGQYIQDGLRVLFETVIMAGSDNVRLEVPSAASDLDGLNFLQGKRISDINRMAQLGTMLAHIDGGVPNILINIPEISENTLGEMIYFFEFACALSGYALGVNPFDQPGVEDYKRNMFALLGKPGYEAEGEILLRRLNF